MSAIRTNVAALERAQDELDGMPDPPPAPVFDGIRYPTVKLALTGGVEVTVSETGIPDLLAELRLGQSFDLHVSGTVTGKHPTFKLDKDGVKTTHTITLTVDTIDLPAE
jgi:hypothetical protein